MPEPVLEHVFNGVTGRYKAAVQRILNPDSDKTVVVKGLGSYGKVEQLQVRTSGVLPCTCIAHSPSRADRWLQSSLPQRGGLVKRRKDDTKHVFSAPPSRGTGSQLGLQALAADKRAARGDTSDGGRKLKKPRLMAAPDALEFDLGEEEPQAAAQGWQDDFGGKKAGAKGAKAKTGKASTLRKRHRDGEDGARTKTRDGGSDARDRHGSRHDSSRRHSHRDDRDRDRDRDRSHTRDRDRDHGRDRDRDHRRDHGRDRDRDRDRHGRDRKSRRNYRHREAETPSHPGGVDPAVRAAIDDRAKRRAGGVVHGSREGGRHKWGQLAAETPDRDSTSGRRRPTYVCWAARAVLAVR